MLQIKRVMTKQAEEELIAMILKQAEKSNMTITNIKEVTNKVISHMEANATLEMEDSGDTESSTVQN